MDYKTALNLTNNNPELAIKLMEATASQTKANALESIANTLKRITALDKLRIDMR